VMLNKRKNQFDGTPAEITPSTDPIVQHFVAGEASEEELAGLR